MWIGAAALATFAVVVALGSHRREVRRSSAHKESSLCQATVPETSSRALDRQRLVYPYSIIPGGVRDAAELREALDRDRVARSHYGDFNVSQARMTALKRSSAFYVSYRLGDRVFWTRKKLWLAQGERVVTDGAHLARARCGNRLSETPKLPTSSQEPPPHAFEAAQTRGMRTPDTLIPPIELAELPVPSPYFEPETTMVTPFQPASYFSAVSPELPRDLPGLLFPGSNPGYSFPKRHHYPCSPQHPENCPHPPPTPTPEPSTILLIACGFVAALVRSVLCGQKCW